MNTIATLIASILVQHLGQPQPEPPIDTSLFTISERFQDGRYRVLVGQPDTADAIRRSWSYPQITDRGLVVNGHKYCIRIIVPDGKHTMPHAVADGPIVPMPTWPGSFEDASASKSRSRVPLIIDGSRSDEASE